jgi:hypothetical protein
MERGGTKGKIGTKAGGAVEEIVLRGFESFARRCRLRATLSSREGGRKRGYKNSKTQNQATNPAPRASALFARFMMYK